MATFFLIINSWRRQIYWLIGPALTYRIWSSILCCSSPFVISLRVISYKKITNIYPLFDHHLGNRYLLKIFWTKSLIYLAFLYDCFWYCMSWRYLRNFSWEHKRTGGKCRGVARHIPLFTNIFARLMGPLLLPPPPLARLWMRARAMVPEDMMYPSQANSRPYSH